MVGQHNYVRAAGQTSGIILHQSKRIQTFEKKK